MAPLLGRIRRHGYAGIGVDGLAKETGVTSGAFYLHPGSKEAAFDIVLAGEAFAKIIRASSTAPICLATVPW